MKKGRKALLIVGIVFAVLVGAIAILAFSGMSYVRKMSVEPVDLSRISDGTYSGNFTRGRFSYSVEVAVKDHRIEAVRYTGALQASEELMELVFDRIIQDQRVDVDTVSGASLTTKAVSKAVENALNPSR